MNALKNSSTTTGEFAIGSACADRSRFVDSLGKSPPSFKTPNQERKWLSYGLAPLHQRFGFALVRYSMIVCSIVGLLFGGGPSTIAWLVIALAVWKPIQRVFGAWSLTHVGKKITKIHPAIADLNPRSTVHVIHNVTNIKATRLHGLPARIRYRVRASMFGYVFQVLASATLFKSLAKVMSERRSLATAIANTTPFSFSLRWYSRNYKQSAKFLTSDVDQFTRHHMLVTRYAHVMQ